MRVLIIEDDPTAADSLAKALRGNGFAVDVAGTGELGDELARANAYDVIVLDWMLPDKSGFSVCRDLRARGISPPILVLSSRDSLEDRVAALNVGADDCLAKSFDLRELLARIGALLRRPPLARPTVLRVADLALYPLGHHVTRAGQTIDLTRKEYAILAVLMRHVGEIVSRTEIAASVWEIDADSQFNTLEVHVSHLRKKIDGARAVPLIRTIRGAGYLLEGSKGPARSPRASPAPLSRSRRRRSP